MQKTLLSLLLLCLFLPACPAPPPATPPVLAPQDPHSFANPEEVSVRHLELDLTVDFERQVLEGRAILHVERHGGDRIVLDTRDLSVGKVAVRSAADPDTDLPVTPEFGTGGGSLGRPLIVPLPEGADRVIVEYTTRPEAGALQWLNPTQTSGEHPFLFTQSQAILARTWVPCQDTPRVRMTYEATVRVPPPLMAVMSAENPTELAADGVYHFKMEQPIPSYLLALAVGELAFRPLGERSGVYAEPSVVDRAAWEFAETEQMIELAEGLYGPYLWGRFDLLVLPPSFPFGGMENPRLTFATPTILAGDRSLTALVAHELAHSWSGNLVTNATWNDLWLNEGFTVYFERRIMEALHGPDYAAMLALLGYQDLQAGVEDLGANSPDTHLRLDLGPERDPDDVFSDIPYEKGYFFLRAIEEEVGRERFDAFLKGYFDHFAFQSVDTATFLDYLREHLLREEDGLEEKLQVAAWIDGPGIPTNCPVPNSPAFEQVEAQIAAWQGGTPAAELATADWDTHRRLHFLRSLPEPMTADQMAELDAAFGLTTSGNAELKMAWFLHVIGNRYEPGYEALEAFLTGMGRRKFLSPLYQKLAETPEGLERAQAIYTKARPTYHPMSVGTVDGILGWKGQE
jgi:leukotriene-A4 hydrolase